MSNISIRLHLMNNDKQVQGKKEAYYTEILQGDCVKHFLMDLMNFQYTRSNRSTS